MGLLQMGAAAELFSVVPGLANIADGGLGARGALRAIEVAIEGGSYLAMERIAQTLEEIDLFIADASVVLDEYDRGRRRQDRLFVPRDDVRMLF